MDILDYQVREVVYESDNSLVYRAYRQVDNQPVILKMLKQAYPTPKELLNSVGNMKSRKTLPWQV